MSDSRSSAVQTAMVVREQRDSQKDPEAEHSQALGQGLAALAYPADPTFEKL